MLAVSSSISSDWTGSRRSELVISITALYAGCEYKASMKKKLETPQRRRRDYVGKSGVYPMSGPLPPGNAPIRGQMEWGQGDRGALGYQDHGSSQLSMDSGVLVGGLDKRWSGAPEPGMPIAPLLEIPVAEWPAFCAWFTENFRGAVSSLERREGGESFAEARKLPFAELSARVLKNAVSALTVVVQAKARKIRLNVTGPRRLKLQRDSAGRPVRLEIEAADGGLILHFTDDIEAKPGLSSNAWGE